MSFANSALPDGWSSAKLSELGTWVGGGTPSKQEPAYWEGGAVPWVSPKDMKSLRLQGTEDHITRLAVEESAVHRFPANSIAVVVRSGILSRTLPIALVPFEGTANQDMRVLIPAPALNPEWMLWFLEAASEDIRRKCQKHGTTVASIEVPRMQEYTIPVPPRAEQDRIVARVGELLASVRTGEHKFAEVADGLAKFSGSIVVNALRGDLAVRQGGQPASDQLDEILARRRRAWEETEPKKRYPDPFEPTPPTGIDLPDGWTWATVDQLSTLVQYGSSAKTDADSGGVPVLRMGNIQGGRLSLAELKYLQHDHGEFPDLFLEEGDLLFNRTNSPELVGKVAVARNLPAPCSFASYLIRVRLADGVLPEWVGYYLNSAYGRAWVRSVVTQQVGQANVNGTKLRAMTVPLPPRSVQRYLVDVVESQLRSVRQVEATIASARQQAVELARSILHAALTGRLDTHRPGDEPAEALLRRVRKQTAERMASGRATRNNARAVLVRE